MEKEAYKYIPLIDGRVVINENIIQHYAPDRDYVLVDGGICQLVVSHLFPLVESPSGPLHLVCAGMLWDQNGTKLILEALSMCPDLEVVVHFAGRGIDVPLIKDAASKDPRIQYEGMLTMDELFALYEKSDILLNLRLEEEVDFHFPSKLLECMATGKHVISTPIAHAERDYGKYITILHDMSPEGLVKKIKELSEIGRTELVKMGKETRRFMLEHRQWAERTKEILNYLNRKQS
jgi:glycosyltransferase involved in cell wall biosynthesis